jgi:dihydropteroate synthase
MHTINCNGKLLELSDPVVMGILNVTPDSFFDGGRFEREDKALARAAEMIEEGATILDIGGMSSRPGASIIDIDEEIRRVLPVIKAIRKEFPAIFISVDTFRKEVAAASFGEGADIINDISGGELDPAIIDFAGKNSIPYVLMHMKGIPESMQDDPVYMDVVQHVLQYLISRVALCRSKGIKDIIVDPGFGFGKSMDHNFELLKNLEVFGILDTPVLVGISRKSMIYNAIKSTPEHALYGTTAAHMVALQQGAKILRVHDVEAARQTIMIFNHLK